MNLRRAYTRAAGLVMLLGITSYSTAAGDPLLALLAAPIALAGWLWGGPPARRALPRAMVNLLLALAAAHAVWRAVSRGVDVDGFAQLVVLVLLIKLGDRRAPRDDGQILALSVFLAIAAVLTDTGFWMGVQLVVMLPVLVAAVMLYQLHAGHEAALGPAPSPTGPLPADRPVPAGRRFARHFRTTAASATVGALLFAAVVFVLMPRGIGRGSFGDWSSAALGSVTGFTDRIQLGQRSVISESPRIVMDVTVRMPNGPNLGGENLIFYLRGAVLDEYDDGVWRLRERGKRMTVIGRRDQLPGEPFPLGMGARQTVEQHVSIRDAAEHGGHLFALWRPVAIQQAQREDLLLNNTDRTIIRRGPAGPVDYTVWSAVLPPTQAEPTERTPASFPSERVRELARTILAEAGLEPEPALRPIADDARAAAAIERYLRENYTYTLVEEAVEPGEDPIEQFLLRTRTGHCEYFASAMTALCRAVGINARIATGYVATEFNPATGHYTVRQSNAHAWVEAELGRGRWQRFDPTPPDDLVRLHRPPGGVVRRLRQMLDAIQYAWINSIVGFDERTRERIFAGATGSPPPFARSGERFVRRDAERDVEHARTALLAALALGSGAALIWMGRAAWAAWRARPAGPRRPGRRRADPQAERRRAQAAFYRALLDLLRRRGHAKPPWRPPLAHAAAVAAADPPLGAVAETLAALYYRLRFGGTELSEEELARARALLAQAEGRC